MNNIFLTIYGGATVRTKLNRLATLFGMMGFLLLLQTSTALAQGSIFGAVHNSNATVPANGEISFYGFTDNTDEEIRLESSVGAGYDAGNWFDDFQNFLSKTPGSPYMYRFFNITNGEGAVLAKTIPNNSFQQEDITLGAIAWPAAPVGMAARIVSSASVVLSWTGVSGMTYHVYRRPASSAGSFFRVDNTAGLLTAPGVADSFFVDTTVSGGGSYQYLLIAQDGSGNLGPHSAILTVSTASIDPPVITSITPSSGTHLGGTAVVIRGSGFDIRGLSATLAGNSLTSVTVVSPYQINGVTPAGTVGAADLVITNTASTLNATLTGAFTYAGNQPPVLAAIGPQTVTETVNLNFNVTATDPDGTTPTLSTSTLPTGATFVDNGGGNGTFNWTPTFTQAGSYNVTFYASDGIALDSEIVTITVNDAGNQPPVLDSIRARTVAEGGTLNFNVTASDPDLTTPSLSATNLPTNATFLDNGDGTGTFNFTPDFTQAGIYDVTFKAFDGSLVDSEVVVITVTGTNQPPVLASIGAQSTTENVNLNFGVTATDPDGTTPTLTTSALPTGATFVDNGNGTGTFDWTPGFTQAGSYSVTFRASDGIDIDSEIVAITVNDAGNQSPILDSIRAMTTIEGQSLVRTVTASDPDGTTPTLGTGTLPANATFADNGDGTGTFTFNPSFAQAGTYQVVFFASDGVLADSELVTITVNESGNQPPILAQINDTTINENDSLQLLVTATDPEGGTIRLTVATSLIGYNFVDSGNGIGIFRYHANYFSAGSASIRFYATDNGSPAQTAGDTVNVTINDVNLAPAIDSLGPFGARTGRLLSFRIHASDSTDPITTHHLTMTATGLPATAIFIDSGNGSASFSFTPTSADVGTFSVTFFASDEGAPPLSGQRTVSITVVAQNNPPVFSAIPPYGEVMEGDTLILLVRASDPDGQPITLRCNKQPLNSTFVDSGNGSGVLTFTPSYVQAGLASAQFEASDGIDTKRSNPVIIQIYEAGNQVPVITPVPTQTITEGQAFTLDITATDPDQSPVTLTAANLPTNATFTDKGNGIGTLAFNPSYVQNGTYDILIIASDGVLVDTVTVTIVVNEAGNQAPQFTTTFTDTSTTELRLLRFTVAATDPDLNTPRMTALNMPTGATLTDNNNGTGLFSWTPTNMDSGHYVVTFYAIDSLDAALYDSLLMNIVVRDTNLPPEMRALPTSFQKLSGYEGDTLHFTFFAYDPDLEIPIVVVDTPTYHLYPNMDTSSIVRNDTLFYTCRFIPDYTQGGTPIDKNYYMWWRAFDRRTPTVPTDVTISTTFKVTNKDQAPIITASIPSATITEGEAISFQVIAYDPDSSIYRPTIWVDTPTSPAGATFSGIIDVKAFQWTPNFTQAGTYNVRFFAMYNLLRDTVVVPITVLDAGNHAPTFTTALPATQSVVALQYFRNLIRATDLDMDNMTITADPIYPFATFTDSGNGSAVYALTPPNLIDSVYPVTFIVSDPQGAADTLTTSYIIVAFLRGDANSDGKLDASDMMFLINFLYKGGRTPASFDAADVNFDQALNIKDAAYLVNYFYKQGPPPPSR
ncbi:Conserved repeat protein (fragment) [Candidatus Zixiibacteriota bacterium]